MFTFKLFYSKFSLFHGSLRTNMWYRRGSSLNWRKRKHEGNIAQREARESERKREFLWNFSHTHTTATNPSTLWSLVLVFREEIFSANLKETKLSENNFLHQWILGIRFFLETSSFVKLFLIANFSSCKSKRFWTLFNGVYFEAMTKFWQNIQRFVEYCDRKLWNRYRNQFRCFIDLILSKNFFKKIQ